MSKYCFISTNAQTQYKTLHTAVGIAINKLDAELSKFSTEDLTRSPTSWGPAANLKVLLTNFQSYKNTYKSLPDISNVNTSMTCCPYPSQWLGVDAAGKPMCGCSGNSAPYYDSAGKLQCAPVQTAGALGCTPYLSTGMQGSEKPSETGYPDTRLVCKCPNDKPLWSSITNECLAAPNMTYSTDAAKVVDLFQYYANVTSDAYTVSTGQNALLAARSLRRPHSRKPWWKLWR